MLELAVIFDEEAEAADQDNPFNVKEVTEEA